ncbi:MAG: response regulator [Rubrivivax sp.]|nr:MAG: response regulator [Rubrivivax sp.]
MFMGCLTRNEKRPKISVGYFLLGATIVTNTCQNGLLKAQPCTAFHPYPSFVVSCTAMNRKSMPKSFLELDPELRQKIKAEQFRMMMAMATPATVAATLFAVLTTLFFHHQVANSLVHWWLGLKIGIALPRILQQEWHRYLGAPVSRRWQRAALLLMFLDGCVWGLAGIWLTPANDLLTSTLIGVGLAGVATLATFTLHSNWVNNVAYCAPMVLPAAIVFLNRHDPLSLYTGTGLLVFLACLLSVAWRGQKHIVELIRLRFETDRIAHERETALQVAERQNAVKSQFVATMSHELRTPLHGILGLTRMIQSADLDPENRKRLGLVERSGEHLLSIINDILDFSRIEAGHLSVENQPFDLSDVLDDLVALTAVTASAKGLKLVAQVQLPRPCLVVGDAARVRQILLNLIGNAVKFTERGQIRLSAHRGPPGPEGEPGPMVMRVSDSGIGIAPQDLATIFDPFHQVDNSLGRRFGGTGLGLTISREISRAMQGEITCSSVQGQGSSFELTVPLPAAYNAAQSPALRRFETAAASGAAPVDARTPVALQGHVLLAEDNEVNAMVVEALLRRHGLTVEHVPDGLEVVQRMCGNHPRPDLVLMDCQMPAMDGFEATRQIRADEVSRGLARTPVVALTASALAEDSERCLGAGMDAHLPKPFREDQLLSVLLAHLPLATPSRSFMPAA